MIGRCCSRAVQFTQSGKSVSSIHLMLTKPGSSFNGAETTELINRKFASSSGTKLSGSSGKLAKEEAEDAEPSSSEYVSEKTEIHYSGDYEESGPREKFRNNMELMGRVYRVNHWGNDRNPLINLIVITKQEYSNAQGERVDNIQYHKVDVWRNSLQRVIKEKIEPGSRVLINGSLHYKQMFVDRDNYPDLKSSVAVINASEIVALDYKKWNIQNQ